MRIPKVLIIVSAAMAFIAMPENAAAQLSSINTYSPYSFYGIGDVAIPGNSAMRGMGGAGIAQRNTLHFNYLNPAAFSAINQQSALFNVGFEGQNFYLRNENTKSSYNTFNITNLALQLPIAKRLGFGFSVSPYSSVGYRITQQEETNDIAANIGSITTSYNGAGGVTQFKAGLGWAPWERISFGAEVVYYHGNITRDFTQTITTITGSGNYINTVGYYSEQVNRFMANFGLQALVLSRNNTNLTLGATYQMGGNMKIEVNQYIPHIPDIPTNSGLIGEVRDSSYVSGFTLPDVLSAGVYLSRPRWAFAADYTYALWGNVNKADVTNDVSFRNTHTIKAGVQFVPKPGDVRRVLNRWAYRAGVRYSNYYMVMHGQKIDDMAVTLGVGIPMGSRALNNLDVGFELGTRGKIGNGLIQENYFKFTVGFSFYGDDYWFRKQKFN